MNEKLYTQRMEDHPTRPGLCRNTAKPGLDEVENQTLSELRNAISWTDNRSLRPLSLFPNQRCPEGDRGFPRQENDCCIKTRANLSPCHRRTTSEKWRAGLVVPGSKTGIHGETRPEQLKLAESWMTRQENPSKKLWQSSAERYSKDPTRVAKKRAVRSPGTGPCERDTLRYFKTRRDPGYPSGGKGAVRLFSVKRSRTSAIRKFQSLHRTHRLCLIQTTIKGILLRSPKNRPL